MKKRKKVDPAKVRVKLNVNQSEFWNRVGVTQSGGSRYENGRSMPLPVRILLGAVYLGEPLP